MTRRGFTLIELMLVVIIIGVLATMVVPRLAGRTQQARVAATQAAVRATLATALDLFELDNGRYPTTQEGLRALRTAPADLPNWRGPYVKQEAAQDAWGHPFAYRSPGAQNTQDYDLVSHGPDGVEGSSDDIVNW